MQTIQNDRLICQISETGAEICSIRDINGTEYLWQSTPPYWASHATNMFPFCGRVLEQIYTYKGKEYSIPNHGFAKVREFTCIHNTGNAVAFRLVSDEQTKELYPFDFILEFSYKLVGTRIEGELSVRNTGTETMIYAIGTHPGFALANIEDYTVRFSGKPVQRVFSDACLDTGKTANYPMTADNSISLHHNMFDHDAIFFQNVDGQAQLIHRNGTVITVSCPDANFWGLWHNPKTEAPFVCIEPWYGIPGREGVREDLSTKLFMIHLPAGESRKYCYSIDINSKAK